MREIYAVDKSMMADWRMICRAYARKKKAELLFVNETSFGICLPDGTMQHIYIDELANLLLEDLLRP